jgi:hypothetical protein
MGSPVVVPTLEFERKATVKAEKEKRAKARAKEAKSKVKVTTPVAGSSKVSKGFPREYYYFPPKVIFG